MIDHLIIDKTTNQLTNIDQMTVDLMYISMTYLLIDNPSIDRFNDYPNDLLLSRVK